MFLHLLYCVSLSKPKTVPWISAVPVALFADWVLRFNINRFIWCSHFGTAQLLVGHPTVWSNSLMAAINSSRFDDVGILVRRRYRWFLLSRAAAAHGAGASTREGRTSVYAVVAALALRQHYCRLNELRAAHERRTHRLASSTGECLTTLASASLEAASSAAATRAACLCGHKHLDGHSWSLANVRLCTIVNQKRRFRIWSKIYE